VNAPYRVATSEERCYYAEVLYPLHDRILAIAGEYGDELAHWRHCAQAIARE